MDRGLMEPSSGSVMISLFTSLVSDMSVSVAYLLVNEAVEFKVESYCDGGTKAVDVTGPDGAAV
ncbi:hypothetical protein KY285_022841 [Solanum tuberosum]|nr:hypothetical protein KY285_022841 [Solanum tuberosum]